MTKNYLVEAWNGIANKTLEHTQEFFSCGTVMCLAGWAVALEYADDIGEPYFHPNEFTEDGYAFKLIEDMTDNKHHSPWDYLAEIHGISEEDAYGLFGCEPTLLDQYEIMVKLFGSEHTIIKP